MKRIISLFVIFAVLLSIVPAVIAEGNMKATITINYIDEEKNTIKDSVVYSESYAEGSAYVLPEEYKCNFAVKTADGKYNHYVFNEGTSQIPELYAEEMNVSLVFNNDMQYDFYEDFENYTIDTTKLHKGKNAASPTIESNRTKYWQQTTTTSSNGAYMNFDEVDTENKTVKISADVMLATAQSSPKLGQFAISNTNPSFSSNNIQYGVNSSSSGHIFLMEYDSGKGIKVNGEYAGASASDSKKFEGTWVHIELNADFGQSTVAIKLTNEAGEVWEKTKDFYSSAVEGNLGSFYLRAPSTNGAVCLDNLAIKITGDAIPAQPDVESVINHKSVYAFGDSIVYGHNAPAKSFMCLIADDYSMKLNMMAKNGATIMPGSNRVLTQINNAPAEAPDFVVFEGYTNDAYGSAETDSFNSSGASRDVTQCYGEITPEGTTSFDNSTFCGAFEETVYAIKQKWPESKVVFVTIHKSGGRNFEIQTKLRDLSVEMCEKWGIEVVDMYNYVNEAGNTLDTRNASEMSTYIIGGKGSHPNEKCCREFYIPAVVEVLEGMLSEAEPEVTPEPARITKIVADYSEDGRLTGVETSEIYSSEAVNTEKTLTQKVFYWNDIDTMEPTEK